MATENKYGNMKPLYKEAYSKKPTSPSTPNPKPKFKFKKLSKIFKLED